MTLSETWLRTLQGDFRTLQGDFRTLQGIDCAPGAPYRQPLRKHGGTRGNAAQISPWSSQRPLFWQIATPFCKLFAALATVQPNCTAQPLATGVWQQYRLWQQPGSYTPKQHRLVNLRILCEQPLCPSLALLIRTPQGGHLFI